MRVYRYGEPKLIHEAAASVTSGTFDGVHLGHRGLLEELVRGECPTVVTFEPHPQHVLRQHPDRLRLLTSLDEKLRKLERVGVERVVIIDFSLEITELSAESFIRDILVQAIGMKRLVVGFNHSFGHDREGDIAFMRTRAKDFDYELVVVDAHRELGNTVSSTRIRRAIMGGQLGQANEFLTAAYRTEMSVVRGEGRGRELGYPTANLVPLHPDQLIPAEGVYAVRAFIDDERMDGVASIGRRETFGDHPLAIEVHVFDRNLELYESDIWVEWIDFLRPQHAFESAEALIVQMDLDSEQARRILKLTDTNGLVARTSEQSDKRKKA